MKLEGRSHRVRRSGAAMRPRRFAFVLTALLSIFLQAFVVQTHVHVSGATYSSASYTQQAGHASDELTIDVSSAGDHQVACVICQAMATAGTALTPSAAIISATVASNADAVLALAQAPRVHTHSWQSRAPPSFL